METCSASNLEVPPPKKSQPNTRTSLKASTIDGVFAAIHTSITSGVLLTNFLLQLGANPVEVGMLTSIPLLANVLQPLGAMMAERTTSRHRYGLWSFGSARLLWLLLVLEIGWVSWSDTNPHQLVSWTLAMVLLTNILQALGLSSWFSWMAALVPQRLRGRYFGWRHSAASLTTLLSVPLLGLIVSVYPGGQIVGYGFVLFLGVGFGLVSISCQFFMLDVNPQLPSPTFTKSKPASSSVQVPVTAESQNYQTNIFADSNFLRFLLYFGGWTFALDLSAPFFNLYLLDNLALDLNLVILYTSLTAAANLIMLVIWGKLADRIGNRPLLLLVGMLKAIIPLLWLGIGTDTASLWLWLPLIHLLAGGTGAAIDLCSNNIQLEVAPAEHPTKYFAIAAAVAGVCGALGITVGSQLAQLTWIGGLPGLFALSAVARLIALLPLIFVKEPRSQSLHQLMQQLMGNKRRWELLPAVAVNHVSYKSDRL